MADSAFFHRLGLTPRTSRTRAVIAALLMGATVADLAAGESRAGSVAGLADREIAKRAARLAEAQRLVLEAGASFDKGDYEAAMKSNRDAWELLADSPATAATRSVARDGYSRAANAQARKLGEEARYAEAKALLDTVLADDFDPGNADAKRFRTELDDPDRFNPALTPGHLRNVADVNSLLRLGNGLMEIGDYDGAIEKYQAVLRIDKFNATARQNMERVEKLKTDYYLAARDATRASRLGQVDAGWEEALPTSLDVSGAFGGQSVGTGGAAGLGRDGILTKLRTWVVPSVDLQGATLEETVEFLRIRSRDLDPRHQGLSFILRVPEEARSRPITLAMAQVPMDELLRYVTQMSGTAFRVDEFAVSITSLSEKTTALIPKTWRVPPDFISNAPAGDAPAGAAAPPDPFAAGGAAPVTLQKLVLRRFGAREFLEQRGVQFPDGATATYNPATNILFVTNTVENLALVDDLVEQAAGAAPKLVEIRVRMLDVSDTQLKELGFDWSVGAFNVPGSNGVFASGGTIGNGRSANFTNQEFPITGPDGITPIGGNPVTAGLRSSGTILGAPSINGLLVGSQQLTSDARSPGVFALAGVFTDPQFQVVVRALSQKKGRDQLSAPSVVTKSGQRASIVIAREFIYPTEFNPPQIPTQIGGVINGIQTDVPDSIPITPTTPTAFAKRDVGVTLEVEPVVAPNNKSIDVNVAPSFTEFEGFINYGTPIGIPTPTGFSLQPNPILQPVFRSNRGSSAVTVYDGATIALSSVITEQRQDINDKVPIVGNLPLVGRAFQSKVAQIERRNIIIMVTVRLLDPGGNPVNPPSATTAAAP